MEENNDKVQLRKGIWSAIGIYIILSIVIIILSNNFLIGLGWAEAVGIVYFIPGLITSAIYKKKDEYFAKGFMIGSLIPIAIAVLAFGGCTLLFSGVNL